MKCPHCEEAWPRFLIVKVDAEIVYSFDSDGTCTKTVNSYDARGVECQLCGYDTGFTNRFSSDIPQEARAIASDPDQYVAG